MLSLRRSRRSLPTSTSMVEVYCFSEDYSVKGTMRHDRSIRGGGFRACSPRTTQEYYRGCDRVPSSGTSGFGSVEGQRFRKGRDSTVVGPNREEP